MGVVKRSRAGRRETYEISFMVDGSQVFETVGPSKRDAERLYARRKKEVREGTCLEARALPTSSWPPSLGSFSRGEPPGTTTATARPSSGMLSRILDVIA